MHNKLKTVADNCVALHEKCVTRHYAAELKGNGTDTLEFHLPFAPDGLWLVCTDPVLRVQDNLVAFFNADLGALGFLCAVSQCSNGGAYYNMAMTNTSLFNRYQRAQDGTVTLKNISAKSGYGIFGKDLSYFVMAVKYTEKTDAERFTELVNRLTGSGKLQVWADKVHAAFTDQQWADLIATKPDWTFEEV